MKKINQKDQREIMLEILDYIHNICIENDLNYSLCGGTFLGAIRHEGFIPWDDDIDIMLIRDDYEKLMALLKKQSKYTILDYQVANYKYMYAKLCDKQSFQISTYGEVPQFGLFVDIFPYDNLPEDESEQKEFMKTVDIMNKEWSISSIKTYFHHRSYIKAFARMILLFPKYLKLKLKKSMVKRGIELNDYMQKYNTQDASYIGYVAWEYTEPIKEKFSKELFEEYENYLFEGKYYRGIKDYDSYLTQLYGDYLKLPSESERENHSYYTWYWRK